MKRVARQFTSEFKRQVVEEIKSGLITKAQAARQYQISDGLIYNWIDHYDHGKYDNEPTKIGAFENKIAALERKVGQQALEIDLLKKARALSLQRIKEQQSAVIRTGPSGSGVRS